MRRTTSIDEQFVHVSGVQLWTARQGSGPPLVLLHGGPGLWDYFDQVASMIDDVAEVFRYDQRGGGRSQDVPGYSVAAFVADLDVLRAHWGYERWIVGGHSWGADLALSYAAEHPERTSAILYLSGTGIIDDWHDEYHENADARRTPAERVRRLELRAMLKADGTLPVELDREYCVLTWMADYVDRDDAQHLAEQLLRPYGPNYALNAELNADWSRLQADDAFVRRVREIAAPVLIMHGAEDPRPPRLAERLAASLPNATLDIVPNAGHLPWVEQPEPTRDTLRTFLASVGDPVVTNAASGP